MPCPWCCPFFARGCCCQRTETDLGRQRKPKIKSCNSFMENKQQRRASAAIKFSLAIGQARLDGQERAERQRDLRDPREKGGANINKRMTVAAETPATAIHHGNWVSVGAVQWPFGCQWLPSGSPMAPNRGVFSTATPWTALKCSWQPCTNASFRSRKLHPLNCGATLPSSTCPSFCAITSRA